MSRTPSTATLTQSRPLFPTGSSQPATRSFCGPTCGDRPPRKIEPPVPAPPEEPIEADLLSSPAESSSSSSSSDSEPVREPVRRSHILKRPPRLPAQKSPLGPVDDGGEPSGGADNDGDEDAFLPFARPASRTTTTTTTPQDPSATIRETMEQSEPASNRTKPSSTAAGKHPTQAPPAVESSANSASSAGSTVPQNEQPRKSARPPGPLSPRHGVELARLSPRYRGKGKDGSDGTPSMGSSFSDLDGELAW